MVGDDLILADHGAGDVRFWADGRLCRDADASWLPRPNCQGSSRVQKHNQGPKQVAGVPPLQAVCEE